MSAFPRHVAAVSAIALIAATPALADLTAADVWADWQESASDFGQTLSAGAQEATGGTLTLRDVSITMDMEDGGLNGTVDEVVMTESGDGSVTITMSPEFPLDMTIDSEEGDRAEFSMVISQPDLSLVASGAPGAISYVYSAPTVTVTMTGTAEGEGPSTLDMTMVLANLAGTYDVTDGEPRQLDSAISVGSVDMDLTGTDAGSDDSFKMTLTMADIASQSSGTFSALGSMTDLSEMIGAGFSTTSTTAFGPGGYVIEGRSEGSDFSMDAQSRSGSLDVSLGPDGLVYGAANEGVTIAFTSSDMPMPEMSVAMESTGARIAMPLTVTEEPQDLALNISLVGLTLSDMIWSMFDPSGALPRDPATLVIDLLAKANWDVDVFDPDVMEEGMDGPPGQLHELDVNEVRLSLAGAELTGSGELDFNNAGPVPMPAGTINLMLVGGNGLLDTLVAMGLVPEDQAMGARMMLGLFARPGDGPDTLVSEITFQEDGAILANGQRIR